MEEGKSMRINPEIFKTYDVRGSYPDQVNEGVFYVLGQSFARVMGAKKIAVGSDNRLSSESLKKSLIEGLRSQGVGVVDIGFCTTPVLYWSVCNLRTDAGLMVTASHLEAKFDGIKAVGRDAVVLKNKEMLGWKKICLSKDPPFPKNKKGKLTRKDVKKQYTREVIKKLVLPWKKLKVVMDSGNGVVGLYLKDVFRKTNLKVIPLFWELDGSFPSRGLNVKYKKNQEKLSQKIKQEKADLGFMWDGDGDRLYVLDSRGEVIDPNFVSAIMGSYLVSQSRYKKVVVEVRTSKVVSDEIKKAGGRVLKTKAWHTEIKKKMRKNPDTVFGSETSGHYIFRDFYRIDDGILAAIYFLNALSARKEGIEETLKEFRSKYFIIEETNFEIGKKSKKKNVLEKIENYYKNRGGKVSKMEGLSVDFPEWRFNLRSSKSEPVLRLNLEADSKGLMDQKKEELTELIRIFL